MSKPNTHAEMIERIAKDLIAQAKGGTIFGEPIDVDDPYQMIVFAQVQGIKLERERILKELESIQ